MATQTVIFAAPSGVSFTARIVKIGTDGTFKNSVSVTQATNGQGLYAATFADAEAGDYSIHIVIGSQWLCVGAVFNVTAATATFYEQSLIEPSSGGGGGGDCPTAEEIADEVESRFSGARPVVQSPFGGTKIELYGGADYSSGTIYLEVTNSAGTGWPDLSVGEWDDIQFRARIVGNVYAKGTGSVVTPTGAGAKVRIAFTHDEMEALQVVAGERDVCTIWALKGTDRFPLLHRSLEIIQTAWSDA